MGEYLGLCPPRKSNLTLNKKMRSLFRRKKVRKQKREEGKKERGREKEV